MKKNKSFKSIFLFVVVSLLLSIINPSIRAQEPQTKDFRQYFQQALAAYKEKNYSAYLENLNAALKLRPGHPTILYNLAGANALVGNKKESLALLSKLAETGLIFPAETDPDFASIKDTEEFKAVLNKFAGNKSPITRSTVSFTLSEKDLVTEGIAFDTNTETFYIGSVHKRKIIAIDKKGAVKDFATSKDGLWSALGMKIDSKRRILWACSAALPQTNELKDEENGMSGIFKFDLNTGKLIKKYILSNNPKKHALGDLALNSKGDVFITDSFSPTIYIISQDKDEMEIFVEGEPFASPQGLAFNEDEKRMFVADYARGLFVIDPVTKKISSLSHPDTTVVIGIDGLCYHKGDLIAVQNGLDPHRVVSLQLNKSLDGIEKFETIEVNNSMFDEPTLGVIVGDDFYFIANSQWGKFDEKSKTFPLDKMKEPAILKTKLNF